MRLDEPAVDLADGAGDRIQLSGQAAAGRRRSSFGEVGLTGELRAVSNPGQRINEAYRLGFHTCIMPMQDVDEDLLQKIECGCVRETVGDAIRAVLLSVDFSPPLRRLNSVCVRGRLLHLENKIRAVLLTRRQVC